MRWKKVYQVQFPGAAERVDVWLREHGVKTQLRGTRLMGMGGEIPVAESWPSVWVPPDLVDAANGLIGRFEEAANAEVEDWTCGACGEEIEGSFGSCWSCGADAPATAALER
jgi:hypothetical protein